MLVEHVTIAMARLVPDKPKFEILAFLMRNKKHVLVEKPLWVEEEKQILLLQKLARENSVQCYTAYNHRFEPHFQRMKEIITSEELGEIYRCRLFYGNGTARLVRESKWRDKGAGVLPDLGSHLLDTILFWFEGFDGKFSKFLVLLKFEKVLTEKIAGKNENFF